MKKIIYILAGMFAIGCTSDAKQETEVLLKDLTPEIVVKQSEEVQPDVLQNNKITLEQGKAYSVSVIFKEDVQLQKGNFLKVKQKTAKEYYADFYGANNNDISEEVVFKKEGFRDYSLQIVQPKVVPQGYISLVEAEDNTAFVTADETGKVVWVFEKGEASIVLNFIAPVFIENVLSQEQEVIRVEKVGDGSQYKVVFVGDNSQVENLFQSPENVLKLPFYALNGTEKSEKIGEIEFRVNFAPYNTERATYYRPHTPNTYAVTTWQRLQFSMNFGILGRTDDFVVFIDNINDEVVEQHTLNGKSVNLSLNNVKVRANQGASLRLFDVYEGELVDGVVVKKANAMKRTIYCKVI